MYKSMYVSLWTINGNYFPKIIYHTVHFWPIIVLYQKQSSSNEGWGQGSNVTLILLPDKHAIVMAKAHATRVQVGYSHGKVSDIFVIFHLELANQALFSFQSED